MNEYPAWICTICGPKYGKNPHAKCVSSFHQGTCGVCGKDAIVTEPRDYGHLKDEWKKHKQTKQ